MPTLVLQRGHVPRTTGATGTAGEQAMAKAVASLAKSMTPAGWKCRVIDADEPTSAYKGDYFFAIHGDGSSNKAVDGASVGYRTSNGKRLATAWKKAYKARGWRGDWHPDNYTAALARYYGTGKAADAGNPRACIIEVGTMTNPADRKWIDAHHREIAESIWDAVAPGWDKQEEEPVTDDIQVHVSITPAKFAALTAWLKANNVYATATKYVNGTPTVVPVNPNPLREGK